MRRWGVSTAIATLLVGVSAQTTLYTTSFAFSVTPVSVHLGTDYVSSFNPIGVGYFDDLSIRA